MVRGGYPKPPSIPIFYLLLLVVNIISSTQAQPQSNNPTSPSPAASPPSPPPLPVAPAYAPRDNILVACGAQDDVALPDGRTFKSDPSTATFLNTDVDVKANANANNNTNSLTSPLYQSARIFPDPATYRFPISQQGFHFIRLYFYPLPHPSYNLTTAVFRVTTDSFVFLHEFSVPNPTTPVFKEYLLNITSDHFTLKFSPKKNSFAFVNAIEVISVPDELISDTASSVSPVGEYDGVGAHALEVAHRVNVGGPLVTSDNDTLWRTWATDGPFNAFPQGAQPVMTSPSQVKYKKGGATRFVAPNWVYATGDHMANSNTTNPNFNLTWKFPVDPNYDYLVRLHFCDIVSESLDELYFNVYLNGLMGSSSLDLSSITGALSTAYYIDFAVNSTAISNGAVTIQVGPGPGPGSGSGQQDAILNGVEVLKMSNKAGSLNGLFDVNGNYMGAQTSSRSRTMKKVAIAGLVLGLTALLLLGVMFVRWHRRPNDWRERRNSFSSWLLPLSSSHTSFLSSTTTSSKKSSFFFGSRKSSIVPSTNKGVGRFFSFSELQDATNNFDEEAVIGVGGFGKVYLGKLDDGTQVAIKRGNPQSEQGITEFQTEIQLLSQLRHRHLVSLMGYCDEGTEMCLVYEYMSNGVLREHLYGSKPPSQPLTWKQRLEICIGAARGLHYLHTGATHVIIHRDVKTTNILLDENFVAKVSDFGLSKAACLMEQTHVSTAVKGSFGYLDPEYFRRQQLTEKSDVYSFGVVLLEVLTARPAINPALPRDQVNLAEWAMAAYRKGLLENIVDSTLRGTINPASLKKYVEAAEKCLSEYGVDRPSMGDVLWNLEYALQLQQATKSEDKKAEDQEDNSAIMIPLETVPMIGDVGRGGAAAGSSSSSSDHHDHTEVSVAAFSSQIANFQGR